MTQEPILDEEFYSTLDCVESDIDMIQEHIIDNQAFIDACNHIGESE